MGLRDLVFGGGPDIPEGPDMEKLLKLQAELNRINQFTPGGSLQFFNDVELAQRNNPNTPVFEEFTKTVNLPPPESTGRPKGRRAFNAKGRRGPRTEEISGFRNVETGEFVETLPEGAITGDPGAAPANVVQELSPELQQQFDFRNQIANQLLGAAAGGGLSEFINTPRGGRGAPQSTEPNRIGPRRGGPPGGGSGGGNFRGNEFAVTRGRGNGHTLTGEPGGPRAPTVFNQDVGGFRGLGQEPSEFVPFREAYQPVDDDINTASNLPGSASRAEQAVFQRASNLLNPEFEKQERRLRQTLANQGLPTGGEAFSGEFGDFNDSRNRAFTDAALRAVTAGNQREAQLFGQHTAGQAQRFNREGQLFNQDLQQQSQQFGREAQKFNQLQSLLGGQQASAPGLSSFFGPSQVDVTGPAQLQQNNQLAGFNAANQQQNAMMGGLFGLGGSFLGAAGAADGFSNLFS